MSLSSGFYINNRQRLMDRLPEGVTVLLFAGDSKKMCQDSEYRFLPDRNFYYMTGLSYETGVLSILKKEGKVKAELYALPRNAKVERWMGKRLDFDKLSEISGIPVDSIYPVDEFDARVINRLIDNKTSVAFDNESIMEEGRLVRERLEVVIEAKNIIDISKELISLRMIKQEEEIKAIREAAAMTERALSEMKKFIRPGVSELELYTALDYHMARQGALIPAFPTIVANGTNAFYLHHSEPEGEDGVLAMMGDTIQIDVGARKDGYCGDISRVYFVGDKTTDDRRFKLLELIQTLRKEAFSFIRPGVNFPELNTRMREITGEWLCANGILNDDYEISDVSKYYWHNTGHHLGLDVHDCTLGKEELFEEGNCLAIEPGVYIPEWGIGYRIEDDVVVTKDGCELLSSGIDTKEDIVITC